MKSIYSVVPENGDYARFPMFIHEEVEHDGAIVEEVRELSPEEIVQRATGAPTVDMSDNSGYVYPSPDYRDVFAKVDELERRIDSIDIEKFKSIEK